MFFSIKIYHTACFFKIKKRSCLRSVDAAWSKVFFLHRVRCGIRLRPAGLRRDKVYRQITCMRHRSLNNFHKNGTITIFQKHLFFEKLWDICVFAPQKKGFVHAPQVEKNPTACILMETSPGMVFRLHHLSAGTGNTAKKSLHCCRDNSTPLTPTSRRKKLFMSFTGK